jgi:hypothetical protein
MSTHRPRLTAGQYAASLRDIAPSITPALKAALKAALASGPLSLAALAAKSGHSFPVTASAVRSQPKAFREAGGLVYAL